MALPQSSKPQEKEAEATCNTLMQDRKYYMECTIGIYIFKFNFFKFFCSKNYESKKSNET